MFFAHIQYPIIDLRPFLNDESKRELPGFPAPMANTWLRNFGHVRERRTDTCPYYIAENKFCEAHNAVRFEKLPLFIGRKHYMSLFLHNINNNNPLWMKSPSSLYYPLYDKVCKFRRFRSDGDFKSCFEMGLIINPISESFYEAYNELKRLSVDVKSYTSKKRMIRTPLFKLGGHICKLYESSTLVKKTRSKIIYPGRPSIVFIDYSQGDYSNYKITHLKEFNILGIDLYHYNDYDEDSWIIVPPGYDCDKKLLASIRRAILAISLEKEALLSAYNFLLLNHGKRGINETKVLRYIKNTQEKLLRHVRFDIPQRPIIDILFKMDFNNNKAFYYDIINLISKVGDKYIEDKGKFIVNDFNKLCIKLEFNEWRKKIIEQLETTDDKVLRRKLKQLRNICITEDRDKFWAFIYDHKIDDFFRNIFCNWVSNYFWEYIKLFL